MKEEFIKNFEGFKEEFKELFKKTKELPLTFILFNSKKKTYAKEVYKEVSDENKRLIVSDIKLKLIKLKADFYISISEGWIYKEEIDKVKNNPIAEALEKGTLKVRDLPVKQECLEFSLIFKSGRKIIYMCEFGRTENDEILFIDDIEDNEGEIGGTFTKLFAV